jgi:hypothetical protein
MNAVEFSEENEISLKTQMPIMCELPLGRSGKLPSMLTAVLQLAYPGLSSP